MNDATAVVRSKKRWLDSCSHGGPFGRIKKVLVASCLRRRMKSPTAALAKRDLYPVSADESSEWLSDHERRFVSQSCGLISTTRWMQNHYCVWLGKSQGHLILGIFLKRHSHRLKLTEDLILCIIELPKHPGERILRVLHEQCRLPIEISNNVLAAAIRRKIYHILQ